MNTLDIKHANPIYARTTGQATSQPVGTVDHMDGEKYIKLRRMDAQDSRHRWIPLSWVDSVRSECVYLNKSEEEFRKGVFFQLPAEDQRLVG